MLEAGAKIHFNVFSKFLAPKGPEVKPFDEELFKSLDLNI